MEEHFNGDDGCANGNPPAPKNKPIKKGKGRNNNVRKDKKTRRVSTINIE